MLFRSGLVALLALDDHVLQRSGVDIHIPQKVVCLAGAGHRDLPGVLAQAGGVALQNQLFVHDGSGHAERRLLCLEGRIDALGQGLQSVVGMDLDAQPPAADADPEVGLRGPAQGAREGPGDLVRKGIGTLDLTFGQLQDLETVMPSQPTKRFLPLIDSGFPLTMVGVFSGKVVRVPCSNLRVLPEFISTMIKAAMLPSPPLPIPSSAIIKMLCFVSTTISLGWEVFTIAACGK